MIFLNRLKWPALLGMVTLLTCVACEEDLTTVGSGIIGSDPFTSSKAVFDVFAYNKNIEAVQTNQLPLYQLGVYNDAVYGRTEAKITSQVRLSQVNPTFGIYNQAIEDNPDPDIAAHQWGADSEEETVKEVYLYIPYTTKSSANRDSDNDGVDDIFDDEPNDSSNDSDLDGVSNAQEMAIGTDPLDVLSFEIDEDNLANTFAKRVDLDSIYGNRDLAFNLKVERSTFFLRDLNLTTSFQSAQEYYSDQEFSPSFISDLLFEGPVEIDDKEILILFDEDDTDTDTNELLQVETRLAPGIRVPLDIDFFQQNIIDREGSTDLISQSNFVEYLRGIHLSLNPQENEEMMLLLDIGRANITIVYDYRKVDTNGTISDTTDDEVIMEEANFTLSLLQVATASVAGNVVNTLINEPYSGEVLDKLDNPENADRVYVKGGAGSYAEVRLFNEIDGEFADAINQIKANNWIVNEANLVFYADRTTLDAMGENMSTDDDESSREPERLYLYKIDTGEPLINFATEVSTQESLFGTFLNYDGIVNRDETGKAQKYTIKITDHINNIVVRDSANVTLGLTLTADANRIVTLDAKVNNGEERGLPLISTLSPVGTVLFGSNIDNEDPNFDKKLKLEIFYTEAN